MTVLSTEKFIRPSQKEIDAMSKEEVIALRRRITSSMTKQERIAMMRDVCEQAARRSSDEYTRKQTEIYKQSDRYKELLKRKQVQDKDTKIE